MNLALELYVQCSVGLDLASLVCLVIMLLPYILFEMGSEAFRAGCFSHSKALVLILDALLLWWGNMSKNTTKEKQFLGSSLGRHVPRSGRLLKFCSWLCCRLGAA